jgi:hypothetical protein
MLRHVSIWIHWNMQPFTLLLIACLVLFDVVDVGPVVRCTQSSFREHEKSQSCEAKISPQGACNSFTCFDAACSTWWDEKRGQDINSYDMLEFLHFDQSSVSYVHMHRPFQSVELKSWIQPPNVASTTSCTGYYCACFQRARQSGILCLNTRRTIFKKKIHCDAVRKYM